MATIKKNIGAVKQYLAGCTASLSFFAGAAAYVWVNPVEMTLLSPDSPVNMTASQVAWAATLPEIGTVLTALPTGYLADVVGRKPVLLVVAPLQLIAWATIFYTSNVGVLLATRLIQGLLLGISCTALPLYLGEIADTSIRGGLGNLFVLSFNFGQLYEFAVGAAVSYRVLIIFSALPYLLFLIGFFWFEESPYYLLMKGKEKRAQKALQSFRTGDVTSELREIQKSILEERENKGNWKDILYTRQGRKGLLLITITSITTFMSGFNALVTYSSETFTRTTGRAQLAQLLTIVLGVLLCVSAFLVSFVMDKMGRRWSLFWSHVGSCICLLVAAVYYYLAEQTNVDVSSWWILPVLGILLSPSLICASISAVRVYQSELFTNSTRGLASGMATILLGAASSLTLRLYEYLESMKLFYLNFVIFSISCGFGAVYIWFFAPETKGKSFDEIQKEL